MPATVNDPSSSNTGAILTPVIRSTNANTPLDVLVLAAAARSLVSSIPPLARTSATRDSGAVPTSDHVTTTLSVSSQKFAGSTPFAPQLVVPEASAL
jgi:hypothetical protein